MRTFQALARIFFFCLLSFVTSYTFASDDLGLRKVYFKVDKVEIKGMRKVEEEAILEKMDIKPGVTVDNYMVSNDIRNIYGLKYFDDVIAEHKVIKGKNVLVVTVVEKPIISEIKIVGNDEVDEDELLEQIKTKAFTILDVSNIKNDVKALEKFYEEKGFYLASVGYELKKNENKGLDLYFRINEFEKVKVKKITFLGNRAFKDSELKTIMETREESLFSWMTGSGNFKEFNFQTDVERLKYFYKTKGYLQVNVGTPQVTVSEDKRWVFITVSVTEGPQFSINNITFDGELLFSEDELKNTINLKSNDIYSEDLLRKDINALTEKYQDEGYAFANVLRVLNIVPGENKVDIQFTFEKGKIAYFGKITVKGNTKTRDKVVRRELRIREGMKYSGSALRRSKENVNRLGFFEKDSVIFNTVSSTQRDDVLDVEIDIKERNTGQLTLGAGYSSSTKMFINASIAQNNFMGKGQILKFSLNKSSDKQLFNLGFTEPYLFDSKWTAGGDIFFSKDTQSSSFDVDRKGFDVRVGHPIFDYARLFLTYKFEDEELSNIRNPAVIAAEENGIASTVESTFIHDRRNNKFEPSEGNYQSFSLEYTGLGGDKSWVKAELDARYYKTLVGELVFRSRLYTSRLFKSSKSVPRSQRFFLGGSRNLRGFGFEAIGPKEELQLLDADGNPDFDDDGKAIKREFNMRGLSTIFSTFELEHPLVKEAGLKWVVFFDAGNIYNEYIGDDTDSDMKMDWGFGFRWFSPIGVLRFEFGYPINKGPDDASNQFHFDIGQLF